MSELKIESKILQMQEQYLYDKAKQKLGKASTEEEVKAYVNEAIYLYYQSLGKPLFLERKAEMDQLPFIEDYENNNEEIDKDLEILFSELDIISKYLVDYFNYAQSEQKRVGSVIKGIHGLVGDLQLLAEENVPGVIYVKESFTNQENLQEDLTDPENRAQISTQEGILTLKRTGSVNQSIKGKVRQVQGNGVAGTSHLVRRVRTTEKDEMEYAFVDVQTPNNEEQAIIDASPDTIYEFQMVNVPESFKEDGRRYDFEWASGDKNNELLRAKIVLQFPESQDINWINVNPYHSPNSTGQVTVHSIRTSEDGFDYKGLYEDGTYILNNKLNASPESYRLEALFDGSNQFDASKFAGQGVWSFPTRKAKYIEFVFEQPGSYTELLGQEAFYKRKKDSTVWSRIRRQEVPNYIIEGKTGVYSIDAKTELKKVIEAVEGWRYVIGLRDIQVMSYEFAETSEYISKPFEVKDGIREILLYANEKIPMQYLEKIKDSNDWIQYYLTFDDITWHRMSPMHHQPVNDEFPPKILAVNGNEADLEKAFQLYRKNIAMKEQPKKVRIKIILRRPKDGDIAHKMTTPIVEDFALKILTEEGVVS